MKVVAKAVASLAALSVGATLVLPVAVAGAGTATQGVTKDQITLGVTYVDLAAIRDIVQLDHGDYEAAFTAVANDINRKGGINGRKLKLVFAAVSPLGTDPAQQACVKLTEDTKVFAAVGFFLADGVLCYLEQHETPVVGGNISAEYLDRANAPWYSTNSGDGTVGQIVDAVAADGVFKKADVGVVALADQKALVDDVVLPSLERNKVDYTSAIIDVPAGDTAAAEQQARVIAEKFDSEGVDTVVVVGSAFVTFAQALENTDYRPRLVSTDDQVYLGYVKNPSHSKSVLQGALSAGPARDFADPAYQDCLAVIEKATGTAIPAQETVTDPKAPNPEASASSACFNLGLFTALADAAGKKLTVASFGKAGRKIGPFELPGYGTVTYDPKTHALSLPVKITRYDSASDQSVQDAEAVSVKGSR